MGKILIVDDSKIIRLVLKDLLQREGLNDILAAESASEAFRMIGLDGQDQAGAGIDLILLDIVLPDMDGIEACTRIKQTEKFQDVPVITGLTHVDVMEQAFEAGGLTGLGNRRRFDEYLNAEWQRARRDGTHLALILVDIDQFKAYNDTYGHQAGDQCLKQVAAIMNRCIQRSSDLVARYGGEEFGIILPATNEPGAHHLAEKIRTEIEAEQIPHQRSPHNGWLTVSASVSSVQPKFTALNKDDLIARADQALYAAKKAGGNCVVLFQP